MSKLITKTTGFGFVWFEFFSDNGKVGFVCSKAEHNEISICSTQAMMSVWVMVRLGSLSSNVIHDFMFPFTRSTSIRQNNCQIFPPGVII